MYRLEFCGVAKWVDERLTEVFSDGSAILKSYMRECVGGRLEGQPKKRWIDSVNHCLKKKA